MRAEDIILNAIKRGMTMNREIKFRGKRIDNGEWEYGHYVVLREGHMIVNTDGAGLYFYNQVDPATVGQFTGLKDKNGREIYEGDIVLATLKFFNINNEKCKVIFHNGSFGIQYGFSPDYFKPFDAWDEVEVIEEEP